MGGDGNSHGSVDARKLLNSCRKFNIPKPRAAVFLGEKDTKQSEFGQLWLQLDGKMLSFIPFEGVGRDLPFGKLAHAHFHLLLFFVEIKFHTGRLTLSSYTQTTGKSACR